MARSAGRRGRRSGERPEPRSAAGEGAAAGGFSGTAHPAHTQPAGSAVHPRHGRRQEQPELRPEPAAHRVRGLWGQIERQALWPVHLRGMQKFLQAECPEELNIYVPCQQELSY